MAECDNADAELARPIAFVIGLIVAIGLYTKYTRQAAEDAVATAQPPSMERQVASPRRLSAELEARIAERPGLWI